MSQALTDVGNIAREESLNRDNDAEMIEKVANVLDKLNATPSKDFDDKVGLEVHSSEMASLLDSYDDIGTIMPITLGFPWFLFGSYRIFGDYGPKLRLQEYIKRNGMMIAHLGAARENLRERKVNSLKQLEAVAEETVDSRDIEQVQIVINEPSSSNKRIGKSKSRCSTGMAFLVIINLLLEIASAVSDQLSSVRKPYFARIFLLLSILSVVISILDLSHKIRAYKVRFLCKWPIPWFYYSGDDKIFGSFADTVLLFCAVGQLIVSTINCRFIERSRDGPIKVSVWPLFFTIGMVVSKFMENPANSDDILPITKRD